MYTKLKVGHHHCWTDSHMTCTKLTCTGYKFILELLGEKLFPIIVALNYSVAKMAHKTTSDSIADNKKKF